VDRFRDIEEKASSSPRSKLNQMLEMMMFIQTSSFQMIKQAFRPSESWGPSNAEDRAKWLAFKNRRDAEEECNNRSADRGSRQGLFRVIFQR